MSEEVVEYEARATYINVRADGSQSFGPCRARVLPSALVILPADAIPVKIQFARMISAQAQNFRVNVETSDSGVFELLRMGTSYQFFADKLTAARRAFEGEGFETLLAIGPGIGFDRLLDLSKLMAEGRAVSKADVVKRTFDFWLTLERLVRDSPLGPSYSRLQSLAIEDLTSIGFKKNLRGNYVWFMMAIQGSVEKGGNTIALEVTSETGHATYLFRVMEREKFASCPPEQFQTAARDAMKVISEAMITTGFRREPIYMDEAKMNSPAFTKYLYATKNLPELKLLRELFYARIIRKALESWAADLDAALLFNVTATEDTTKWEKSQTDPELAPD